MHWLLFSVDDSFRLLGIVMGIRLYSNNIPDDFPVLFVPKGLTYCRELICIFNFGNYTHIQKILFLGIWSQ